MTAPHQTDTQRATLPMPAPSGSFARQYEHRHGDGPPAGKVALRNRLPELLGIPDGPHDPPAVRLRWTDAGPDHQRSRIEFESPSGDVVPAWLLVPHTPLVGSPAVIAVHGHGSGVNEIVGLRPDGRQREAPAGYQKDFALELVRHGFLVAAPEMLGFGTRREIADIEAGEDASSCRTLATWALMLGTTLLGRRVLDLRALIDLLAARDDVDASAIGIMGISGGATASLLTAALDERISAAVLSGYVSTFRESVLAVEHCLCNVVPGLVAEAEMADLALLLAPRPLLLEAGRTDTVFPFEAVETAAGRIRDGYLALGAGERFEVDAFEGGHEISGVRAYDFLARWLGDRSGEARADASGA